LWARTQLKPAGQNNRTTQQSARVWGLTAQRSNAGKKRSKARDDFPADDELFVNVLGKFDGDYGEDIVDEDHPYAAPGSGGKAARSRKRGSAKPMSLAAKCFAFEGRINRGTFWSINFVSGFLTNVLATGIAFMAGSASLVFLAVVLLILLF